MDLRKWAKNEREIAKHELAIAALFLAMDQQGASDVHQQSYEQHIRTAIIFEKGADEIDAIRAKYDLK